MGESVNKPKPGEFNPEKLDAFIHTAKQSARQLAAEGKDPGEVLDGVGMVLGVGVSNGLLSQEKAQEIQDSMDQFIQSNFPSPDIDISNAPDQRE